MRSAPAAIFSQAVSAESIPPTPIRTSLRAGELAQLRQDGRRAAEERTAGKPAASPGNSAVAHAVAGNRRVGDDQALDAAVDSGRGDGFQGGIV